jgi:hypothetical protein
MNNTNEWDKKSITVVNAFDAMRRFLEIYWESGGRLSEDIAMLLSSLDRNEENNALPVDAALWHDWIKATSEYID